MSTFFNGTEKIRRADVMRILIDKYGEICYLCGLPPTETDKLNIEHWFPQAWCRGQGWKEERYNEIENLRPSHESCNRQKSDTVPYEGWVFTPPPPKTYPTKTVKSPLCETCLNGMYLSMNEQCPDCFLDNSKRRFPKVTQLAPKECPHEGIWHCWWCVVHLDRDWIEALTVNEE